MFGKDKLKKSKNDTGNTTDPNARLESDKGGRAWVQEYLAGMNAVKDGDMVQYTIDLPGGTILVTPENVDDELEALRTSFEKQYPDVFAEIR